MRPFLTWCSIFALVVAVCGTFFAFQQPPTNAEVQLAKIWYQTNHHNSTHLNKVVNPDWANATTWNPDTNRTIIDVPLLNSNEFRFRIGEFDTGIFSGDTTTRNGSTRLVICKYNKSGDYAPYILEIIGACSFFNQYGANEVKKNVTDSIIPHFTGVMLYYQLKAGFYDGRYFVNGVAMTTLELVDTSGLYGGVQSRMSEFIYLDSGPNPSEIKFQGGGSINGTGGSNGNSIYSPPPDPNFDEGANNGPGQCKLTHIWEYADGPYVAATGMLSTLLGFWADTKIFAKLINCRNGTVTARAEVFNSGTGATINSVSTSIYVTGKYHDTAAKTWVITTYNNVTVDFTITVAGLTTSGQGSGGNQTTFDLTYL